MHNIPQTQDTAHTSVNHRRKLQVLKIFNCFNFFTDLVLMCCKTYFETKYGIILLYVHITNTSFSFYNDFFWGVDSKSAIHFFRPALENPDNLEKTTFSGLSGFSGV